MVETVSITVRGSNWDKHDRAWAKYNEEKAKPGYRPAVLEKLEKAKRNAWQQVDHDTRRRRVAGGWIYRSETESGGGMFSAPIVSVSQTFVPDLDAVACDLEQAGFADAAAYLRGNPAE